nr:G-protein coupled receptor family C group 5 member C isoform X2 [Camelus dromedarius]
MQAPAHPRSEKGAELGERPERERERARDEARPAQPGSRGEAGPAPRSPVRAPPAQARAGPGPAPCAESLPPSLAPRLGPKLAPNAAPELGRRRVPGTQVEPGLGARMAVHKALLTCLGLPLFLFPGTQAQNSAPPGCSPDLNPLYYNLCDRSGAWGIILEAVAGAGIVTTFVLTIILVASLPFVQDTKKRSLLGTQVFFLLGTLGLFCLVFACVVKPDFSTCASRRFLFGVLFAICFSCLVAHVFALNFLVRKNRGPRGWVTFTVALLLSLVEVIINTEWLIITLVRGGGGKGGPPGNGSAVWADASPCAIANMDFVMALIYVMLLLLCAFSGAWPALCGRFRRWRKHGVFVLLTTATSIAIWVVWIVMYTYGNKQRNSPTWDDPTLAIALAANAWAFVLFYVIPEVSQVTKASPEQSYQGDLYPTRGVGYETILKEQKGQSMFVENKAFSMDEPASGKRPVSPYSGYNGQLLTSVYQPTEMALMHKAPSEGGYDVILPRATANSQVMGSANSTLRAEDIYAAQSRQETTLPKEGKNSQVFRNPYVWD